MNTVESLGYLKGLLNGLGIDDDKKEAKVYEEIDAVEEQVDAIDEDLADVEAFLDDDCDCGCDCDCDCDDECEYELECPSCGETIVVDECTIDEGGIECPSCGEYLELSLIHI